MWVEYLSIYSNVKSLGGELLYQFAWDTFVEGDFRNNNISAVYFAKLSHFHESLFQLQDFLVHLVLSSPSTTTPNGFSQCMHYFLPHFLMTFLSLSVRTVLLLASLSFQGWSGRNYQFICTERADCWTICVSRFTSLYSVFSSLKIHVLLLYNHTICLRNFYTTPLSFLTLAFSH